MNFFEHQDQARRNTKGLVFFLLLAVAGLIALTILLVVAVIVFQGGDTYPQDASLIDIVKQTASPGLIAKVSALVAAVIGMACLYKMSQLSAGGQVVAESMGGRLLNLSASNANERKILNIVEEMAIASGTPVPPVYLIDEAGINAFAAGYKPQDAVIGVTRGCIDMLSREELQGVIAHEFSHILNGDMRLNIRLISILHGILVIGLLGYWIFRSSAFTSRSRSSRNNNGAALGIVGLGLAMMAIGYAGTFFGKLIKAAVSRQREYLADASAVQFSRNPDGISGALKKIGGYEPGSLLENENAAEFSHMYFGEGVQSFFGMLATHPPLEDRIKRLDPKWKGGFASVSSAQFSESEQSSGFAGDERTSNMAQSHSNESAQEAATQATAAPSASAPSDTRTAIESIGDPSDAHIEYAHTLIAALPADIREACHDSFSARALIYNLLMSNDPLVADKQRDILRQNAHPSVAKLTVQFAASMASLKEESRLPILELSIPAIKAMAERQYEVFKRVCVLLIQADQKIELHEWAIYRILLHNVEPIKHQSSNAKIASLRAEVELLLSALSHAGHAQNDEAARAFNVARDELALGNLSMLRADDIDFPTLDKAVQKLSRLKPLQKPLLLKAMASCISYDGKVTAEEAELFRAVADSLDCPVPPLLPQQRLS